MSHHNSYYWHEPKLYTSLCTLFNVKIIIIILSIQIDQKAVDLQQRFGRVRYSSTGNVKICYSESSNTSMEDVSKN